MDDLRRLLSHVWPLEGTRIEGRHGPLYLTWENGRRVVNGERSNQSYGSLHRVWQLCFTDAAVAAHPPGRALILGFGGGSAATILRRELGLPCPITGVDADPAMLTLARDVFHVDALGGITLIEQDALAFVRACTERYDLVVVDLFRELDLAPGVEDRDFIAGLRACTAPGGLLCFNTVVHDDASRLRSRTVADHLSACFGEVAEHRYERLNRVFMAR